MGSMLKRKKYQVNTQLQPPPSHHDIIIQEPTSDQWKWWREENFQNLCNKTACNLLSHNF